MDITAVREGVGTALATIVGLRVADHVAGQVNPPQALVGLPRVEFDNTAARGSDVVYLDVRVFVAGSYNRTASDALSGFLAGSGAQSIKAAVEADPTLSGSCDTVRVLSAEAGWADHGNAAYLIADFELEVVG